MSKFNKHERMFEDDVITDRKKVKEMMDYSMGMDDGYESDEYQTQEEMVIYNLAKEIVMNTGVDTFIECLIGMMDDEGMYEMLMDIADDKGVMLSGDYMDNLHATVDMMSDMDMGDMDISMTDSAMSYNMPLYNREIGTDGSDNPSGGPDKGVAKDTGMNYNKSIMGDEKILDAGVNKTKSYVADAGKKKYKVLSSDVDGV